MNQPWSAEKRLADLKVARDTLCSMQAEIVINSDLYRAASSCIRAIDEVAKGLTGDDRFFTRLTNY